MTIYSTKIINIGDEATNMIEAGFFILFGDKVPDELKNYCYIIEVQPVIKDIVPGNTIILGDQRALITSVGNEALTNLRNLGHVTVKFDGSTTAELPGTIYVENIDNINLCIGDSIKII